MDESNGGGGGSSGEEQPMLRVGALRSPVIWAILGLVIEKPSYGYEIAVRLERRFAPFMSVRPSNVYTTLDRLVDRELIEEVEGHKGTGSQRLRRQRYRSTALGARAYKQWLALRIRDDCQRVDLLVRLVSVCMRGTGALLELLGRYESECVQEAQELAQASRDVAPGGDLIPGLIGRLLASERQHALNAQLHWVQQAQDDVRRYAADQAARRSPAT